MLQFLSISPLLVKQKSVAVAPCHSEPGGKTFCLASAKTVYFRLCMFRFIPTQQWSNRTEVQSVKQWCGLSKISTPLLCSCPPAVSLISSVIYKRHGACQLHIRQTNCLKTVWDLLLYDDRVINLIFARTCRLCSSCRQKSNNVAHESWESTTKK